MEWDVSISNPQVAAAYGAYRDFVMDVATHYAGSRLIECLEIDGLKSDSELALSDNFPDGLTTICTIADLVENVQSGEYGQLSLRLATVQLCTAFEVLFDAIGVIYSVNEGKSPVLATYKPVSPDPIPLGNKTIKKIRNLHDRLGMWSVINNDEALVKIAAIIEVRNCIVHSAGRVTDSKVVDRLKAYGIRLKTDNVIMLCSNILDDFLHYMAIHVVALVKKLP